MNKDIGKRIKDIREAQNMTKVEFAEIAGISVKFLYEIESGRKGFSANNLYNIAKGLSVSCEYIMDGNEHAGMQVDQLLKSLSSLSLRQRRKMYDILQDFSKFIFMEAEGGRAI